MLMVTLQLSEKCDVVMRHTASGYMIFISPENAVKGYMKCCLPDI